MVKTRKKLNMASSRLTRHLVYGGCFLTAGITLLFSWPCVYDFILDIGFTLSPDNFAFKLWKENPMPMHMDFFFLNWTNADEVMRGGSSVKPRFQEVGPFVFREMREKTNFTWHPHNESLTFFQRHTWWFDRERSVSDLDVNITTANAVSVAAAYQARNWGYFMKRGLSITLRTMAPRLDITKTAGELLFFGYEDVFVTMSYRMPINLGAPKFERFAWFYTRNGSETFDGIFNIRTNHRNLGEMMSWNHWVQTPYFDGECGKVQGSSGEFYTPRVGAAKEKVTFFSPDMSRPMTLDYIRNDSIKGILGYRYEADKSFLDNGTKLPENLCYSRGERVPSGVQNVSSSRYGTPAFISLPHFYGADPYYLSLLKGVKPEADKHSFQMTLEPTTGIPLSVTARLQLNILVRPVKHITQFENVPTVFFPVLWFQQSVELPDFLAIPLHLLLAFPTICQVLCGVFLVTGFLIVICATYTPVMNCYYNARTRKCQSKMLYRSTFKQYEVAKVDQEKGLLS